MSPSCPRLSISPFSGGREEEIVERRGGGGERGSFFPFAVSPFHIFLSPFPQKPLTLRQGFWAPDFGYLDAGQQPCCSCFCFCTVKLHVPICSHCSALQWMQKNKTKPNKILARCSKINWTCLWNEFIFLQLTSCICCHGTPDIAGKVS